MPNVGKKLKEFGLKKFENIKLFAEALGVKREQLYPYFNNSTMPGGSMLKKLKDMGCDLNWLLADDEGPPVMKEPSFEYKTKQLEETVEKLEKENATLRTQLGRFIRVTQAVEKLDKLNKKKKK